MLIYIIENPYTQEPIYVGATHNIRQRIWEHMNLKHTSPLYRELREIKATGSGKLFLPDKLFKRWEEVPPDIAQRRLDFWVHQFTEMGYKLHNDLSPAAKQAKKKPGRPPSFQMEDYTPPDQYLFRIPIPSELTDHPVFKSKSEEMTLSGYIHDLISKDLQQADKDWIEWVYADGKPFIK